MTLPWCGLSCFRKKRYMKRFFLLSLLLAVAVACCRGMQHTDTVRVMSFNIRLSSASLKDGRNCWRNRREAVVRMLQEVSPGIFALQEAMPDQRCFIDSRLDGYVRIGLGRDYGDWRGEMVAVYYDSRRFDLVDSGTFWLSETPSVPSRGWDAGYNRTATWGRFRAKASGREFLLVNTHLDHKGRKAQTEGVKLLRRMVEELAGGLPAVLCGDFNLPSSDEAFLPLQGFMQLGCEVCSDTDISATFHSFGRAVNPVVIDHIYVRGVMPLRYSVLKDGFGVPFLSDHYPVFIDFVLE